METESPDTHASSNILQNKKGQTYMDAAPESSAISARLILLRFFQGQRIPPCVQGPLFRIVAAKPDKETVC
jgi:hypothetical protein